MITPAAKRIFVVGPPGCQKKEIVDKLAAEFDFAPVHFAELLNQEIASKSDLAERIADAKARLGFGTPLG